MKRIMKDNMLFLDEIESNELEKYYDTSYEYNKTIVFEIESNSDKYEPDIPI